MQSIAKATGAPVRREIGGKPYDVYPLTWLAIGRLEGWMRQTLLSASAAAMGDVPMKHADKRIFAREAHAQATLISVTDKDAAQGLLGTLSGLLHVTHLSLQRGDAKLTLEQVEDLFDGDMNDMMAVASQVMDLTFPGALDEAAGKTKGSENDEADPTTNSSTSTASAGT